ncbi:MAG: manganese efflux pump MntP family protein [Myxococcota bacterium]|nr:manganese efflux pump MntP family protein [Myxococcota bacterium]MDW8362925.1 manganese efflux pump [Myxococcales bacterium]
MPSLSLVPLGLGLAVDAAVVAAAAGLGTGRLKLRVLLAVTLAFGVAQAVMPLVGASVMTWVGAWVASWDHWIAFVVLCALGVRAIAHSLRSAEPSEDVAPSLLTPFGLLSAAVATSIDALGAGLALPATGTSLPLAASVIGATTAVCCATAYAVATLTRRIPGRASGVLAGLALVGVGIHILIEHLATHA